MRILVGTMLAVTLVAVSSFAADQTSLSVGRVQAVSSVPVELVARMRPELKLIDATQWRSEVFPSTTPLPESLSELPDVVSALVGFYDNDIPYLCEKGLIEPLDAVFAELKLDPKEVIPANIYEAVVWKGKVYALPYRIESYVLRYHKDVMEKVGVEPVFHNWNEVLIAAEKISTGADPEKQLSGFLAAFMPDEHIACCLLGWAMDTPAGAGKTFLGLLEEYQTRKVIWPDRYEWGAPEDEVGIRFELFRKLTLSANVKILPFPAALMPGSAETIRPVGLMECFALRKNTKDKAQAVREFIKLLLTKEAQIALVEATQLDKRPNPDLAFRHVPVFKHVVDSPEFCQIASTVPGYRVLLDTCMKARFTPADPARFEPQRKVLVDRYNELPELLTRTHSQFLGFMGLMKPMQIEAQPATPVARDVSRY